MAEDIDMAPPATEPGDHKPLHDSGSTEKTKLVDKDEDENQGCSCKCPIERGMIYTRLLYLTDLTTQGCAEPYYSVYFKQKGFSPEQIGLFFGVRPIIGLLASPLWGLLADKFKIRRALFFILWISWVASVVALGTFPYPKRAETCPSNLQFECNNNSNAQTETTPITEQPLCVDTLPPPSSKDIDKLKSDIGWIYDSDSLQKVMIALGMLVLCGELFQATVGAFVDVGVLNAVRDSKGTKVLDSYGSVRSAGSAGWAIGSFVTGALLSTSRHSETICGITLVFSNYLIFVYIYLAAGTACLLAGTQVKFDDVDQPEEVKTENQKASTKLHNSLELVKTFATWYYGSFLLSMFLTAMGKGLFWAFLNWHLENLGGTQLVMGLQSVAECLGEIITFHFCEHYLLRRIGPVSTFCSGSFIFSGVCILYGIIPNPWLSIPIGVGQGTSFAMMWSSIIMIMVTAVPEASQTSALGIVYGIHYGAGFGTGKMVGGFMISAIGAKLTFCTMGGLGWLGLLVFLTVMQFTEPPVSTREIS